MRTALLSLSLLIAACSEAPNRQEFTNEQIALLQLHERVGVLSKQLGTAPTMTDLMPLTARVEALEATAAMLKAQMAAIPKPGRVPHLFAGAEDLGAWAGGTMAYSADHGHVTEYGEAYAIGYPTKDCTGDDVCIISLTHGLPGMVFFARSGGTVQLVDENPGMTCINADIGDGQCREMNNGAAVNGHHFHDAKANPIRTNLGVRIQ